MYEMEVMVHFGAANFCCCPKAEVRRPEVLPLQRAVLGSISCPFFEILCISPSNIVLIMQQLRHIVALRTATRHAHDIIESHPFSQSILQQQICPIAWAAMITGLHTYYTQLESTLASSQLVYNVCTQHGKLARAHILSQAQPVAWQLAVQAQPSIDMARMQQHIQHIQDHVISELHTIRPPVVHHTDPLSLHQQSPSPSPPTSSAHHHAAIGHAYTRYMGDLLGGAILRPRAAAALRVPTSHPAVAYLDFDNIAKRGAFVKQYRLDMNELLDGLTSEQRGQVEAAASHGFVLSMSIFDMAQQATAAASTAPITSSS